MKLPRDENLRLIGTAEEAEHIRDGHRFALAFALLFGVLAAGDLAALAMAAGTLNPGRLIDSYPQLSNTHKVLYAVFPALVFLALFYAGRALRYVRYRHRHRAFLRKHNRL